MNQKYASFDDEIKSQQILILVEAYENEKFLLYLLLSSKNHKVQKSIKKELQMILRFTDYRQPCDARHFLPLILLFSIHNSHTAERKEK